MKRNRDLEIGMAIGSTVAIITLSVLVVGLGAFGYWSYTNYLDQKKDVDGRVLVASAEAVKANSEKLQQEFEIAYDQPLRQFTGPDDYGRLTFDYPRTWNAYQATDISKGGGVTYEAYLNPVVVPPITPTQKYALRIVIEQKTYDQSLKALDSLVKEGKLKTTPYSEGKLSGTRVVGNFSKEMVSDAVYVKMRDRTLILRTDGDVFKDKFEEILKTVSFNE